jgi:pyrimidine-specific ribonucleoside hydrolase
MARIRVAVGVLVSALLVGACTDVPQDDRTPVVVDTDMGQDDMMALLFLLQRPDVRVEAITVSGTGLAHCDPGVRIVLSLLDVAGAPEDVPVSCGPQDPLPGTYPFPGAFPTSWRAATDDAYGIDLPASDREPSGTPAPELLRTAIREAGAPVELLTLGPLTNVAIALRDDPALVDDLARVTIMGGALDVPGNVIRNAVAEFNVWVDPVAAGEVIAAGAPVTLVPLDATNDAPVTAFFADVLAGHHETPEARTVQALFDAQPFLLSGQYYFWDPLSAAILVEPDLAAFEDRTVTVLEGEKETQGRIVDDPSGTTIQVAITPDSLEFEREFLNTLNGDERAPASRPDPVARIEIGEGGCAFHGSSDLPPELVAVELDNTTTEPWTAVLASIADGHTYEDLVALVRTLDPTEEPPSWITGAAFTEAPPATSQLVAWRLEPGTYGLVCTSGRTARDLQAVTEIVAG